MVYEIQEVRVTGGNIGLLQGAAYGFHFPLHFSSNSKNYSKVLL